VGSGSGSGSGVQKTAKALPLAVNNKIYSKKYKKLRNKPARNLINHQHFLIKQPND
jgi:hypothetical protein